MCWVPTSLGLGGPGSSSANLSRCDSKIIRASECGSSFSIPPWRTSIEGSASLSVTKKQPIHHWYCGRLGLYARVLSDLSTQVGTDMTSAATEPGRLSISHQSPGHLQTSVGTLRSWCSRQWQHQGVGRQAYASAWAVAAETNCMSRCVLCIVHTDSDSVPVFPLKPLPLSIMPLLYPKHPRPWPLPRRNKSTPQSLVAMPSMGSIIVPRSIGCIVTCDCGSQ